MEKIKLFVKKHLKKILIGVGLTVATFGTYGLFKLLKK